MFRVFRVSAVNLLSEVAALAECYQYEAAQGCCVVLLVDACSDKLIASNQLGRAKFGIFPVQSSCLDTLASVLL